MRALFLILGCLVTTPAIGASCIPSERPPANHPSLAALPDSYWTGLQAWSDLPPGDRALLARVSIVQRDVRALNPHLTFSDEVPRNVVPLRTAPDQEFVADGAASLDALVLAARLYLRDRGSFYVSNGFRSYAVQLETWPRNLEKYLARIRADLPPANAKGYSDDAVCALRAYAGSHYAFPGYSNHQSGRAADFHFRAGDAPELNSDSGGDNIARWCKSDIYGWLHRNARSYGFIQAKIDEPWHWVYDPGAAKTSEADRVATSCQGKID
ncbi:MAG: D-alanyl-D-alanine carboxypeptidase family protein [Alphaproteobacteria bacterium]|nr:D-alanyl-D-alanine carboxypeptidase family protein [Alphaproteobacteria bacterium]MBL6936869.1 D-alanyl-D-alanine carboxypeptidase family protein [Alphaproteobacteria bacterium]MBL7097638.1 D-alanyl-D-alanine carboxypeptidase family protein [Alphaproteobacteria bacterium]